MALGLEERASLGWLALLRLATGALFVEGAVRKLSPRFDSAALQAQLDAWRGAGRMTGLFREQVLPFVGERLALFSTLATVGELGAGVSLVLGLASRVGALAGLLLNVAWLMASGEQINILAGLVNLAVLVAGGGRALGLDGLIRAKSPRFFLG